MNTCPDCQNDLVCHDQGECLRPTPETDAFRNQCFEHRNDELEKLYDHAEDLERKLAEARQAFAIATDQLVQVQSELRQAREENARLREAVSKVLNFIPAPTCDQMHHTKKDRHEYGKTCPPVERVKAIIDNARKILTP